MSKASALTTAVAIVIAASVPSFRRAGLGFTDKGTAFAKEQLSDEQLAAIQAEPRLSVREMPADKVPEGVDSTPLQAFMANAYSEEKAKEPTPAKKASPAKGEKADNAGA